MFKSEIYDYLHLHFKIYCQNATKKKRLLNVWSVVAINEIQRSVQKVSYDLFL